jgi:hypothetical protein
MGYVRRKPDKVPRTTRGFSFLGTILLGVGAFVLAWGAADWIGGLNPDARASADPSAKHVATLSFEDRFSVGAAPPSAESPRRSVGRFLAEEFDIFEQPVARLAQKLRPEELRPSVVEESKPVVEEPKASSVTVIPLPRSRPVEANLELPKNEPVVEQRSWLEKFTDLFPNRMKLASLGPDGGLFAEKPDLAALGYDHVTAVYDISARVVYMPDGSILEAHSGLGSLMDDPAHVSEPNLGATPPNVYDLKLRESLFHGVPALRLTPVDESGTFGRTGLLVHTYMLDPGGGSNGCVSIKYYDRFLKAFTNGEIKRLVVVPRLRDEKSGPRQST